ncbi:MAG: DUF1858 domain-containing protein, partial [Patescibacteria group bacterium]
MVSVPQPRHNQAKRKTSPVFTRHMRVMDVTALMPEAVQILAEYGIQCAGCSIGGVETLEEGCRLPG